MIDNLNVGSEVSVVERDKCGKACEVTKCLFLAGMQGYVICVHWGSDELLKLSDTQTIEIQAADTYIFPSEDCYETLEEAKEALKSEVEKIPDKDAPWSKRAPFDPKSITCGRCDCDISDRDFEYCPYCGQKLGWSCLSDSETSFEMDGKTYNVFPEESFDRNISYGKEAMNELKDYLDKKNN